MTSPSLLAATALLALLVGAAMPVLYQLYQTLKRARALLDTAGPRLERALDQVGEAADRLNGIGSSLEAQAQTSSRCSAPSPRWAIRSVAPENGCGPP